MDKPINLSVKNFIIRKMASKMMIAEPTIDSVIMHQFTSAIDALSNPSNKSVEISGFGKFLYKKKFAEKALEKELSKQRMFTKKLEESISEKEKKSWQTKLNNTNAFIEYLKAREEHNED